MKKLILILGLAAAALSFGGCDTVRNAVYDEVRTPTGEVKSGDGVLVSALPADVQEVAIAQGYDMTDVIFLDEMDAATVAKIRAENPAIITPKTREYYTVEYKLTPAAEAARQATGAIPIPGANYIPIILGTIGGVVATWMKTKKTVAKAQKEVSIKDKAIDTFAEVDDGVQNFMDLHADENPELVKKYYAWRGEALRVIGGAKGVLTEVEDAVNRNATPTQITAKNLSSD
ncbi:hypothetical protein [Ruficoccus sp. ZRK36]|uniref:hypothetical protein n=1 Tax=Ruficoccus sp. ZRK36 TaxID=2866311 RepID=UPI001C73D50F|nr:hypothetical protein [Ruficoccus sp. ZRK36]QYY35316.1 hypothetical protein K0V07_13570 [Ruficoccus sp. ZRK36]